MAAEQKSLFGEEPEPWEEDDATLANVATVVFSSGPEQPFDYSVPDVLADKVAVGKRLRVPLGRRNRPVVAYCVGVEIGRKITRKLKPVAGVVDRQPILSPAMIRLTQFIAEHYLAPWGTVLERVVPAGVRGHAGTRDTVVVRPAAGIAEKLGELKLPKKQLRALEYLIEAERPLTPGQLALAIQSTTAPIATLRRKGLLVTERQRVMRPATPSPAPPREEHLDLNPDQQSALDAITEALRAQRHETLLLYGVTGSGKTEVYIQAIQEVIGYGRQAIVLVPEISLTPQTVERFRTRFPGVAILHSHQTDAERHWHWQQIAAGKVQVVVGPRSAIFAPVPHLGLIVLDEEHEATFKQESSPRYHARDVAAERARAESVPLVLGSATPSLESWQRVLDGKYRMLELPRRVYDRPMPYVATIDLRYEKQEKRRKGAISRVLRQAMETALGDGGQVILLLNRRGYSTHIQCPACGTVVQCPSCDIALTHHREQEIALCHYCDYQAPAPHICPSCSYAGIQYAGLGTQRLEAEVRARFPGYDVLRMDTDSMRTPRSHEKALAAFRAGEVKILLGTQMIAKGLDFPNVTLVGVVNADTALHLPDFRAAERTFQLLAQVAGRTGRGDLGGRVLIQTLSPEHPAIRAAVKHDFRAFAEPELRIRRAFDYPPFANLVRIVVRGPEMRIASAFADEIRARLKAPLEQLIPDARLLGPAPAPIARLRGMHRFQLQIHGALGEPLRQAVREATADLSSPDGVEYIVDVDPVSML